MSDKIKLGELEFKSTDFFFHIEKLGVGLTSRDMSERANRILREKLVKASKVYGHEDRDFGVMVYFNDEDAATENTHTARLVCIAPIGATDSENPIEETKK